MLHKEHGGLFVSVFTLKVRPFKRGIINMMESVYIPTIIGKKY